MVDPTHLPEWMRSLNLSRIKLYPGASEEALMKLEENLGLLLPKRYLEFMAATDGLHVPEARNTVELYPIGSGDIEPLKVVNRERFTVGMAYTIMREKPHGDPVDPLLVIGETEDEDGDVGFMLSDLRRERAETLPVWDRIEGEYCWTSPSFEEFVASLCKIGPGDAYESNMSNRDPVCWKPAAVPQAQNGEKKWWQIWKRK